ncbi:hypothetical protein BIW11_14130 [Tropilaelaps mercedesae]|uniref:Uncharacterized protein n=1 Tax=Tropilaelaps mercedesae TaxID=418985 RepID=A0A1V9WYX4_9ACAR|nr:hypothetical protein BIW11_14130 [Tropilaelaps mercedesae]
MWDPPRARQVCSHDSDLQRAKQGVALVRARDIGDLLGRRVCLRLCGTPDDVTNKLVLIRSCRFVEEHNMRSARSDDSYELGLNVLSDLSVLKKSTPRSPKLSSGNHSVPTSVAPSTFTSVKDQGAYGTRYGFVSAELIESALMLKRQADASQSRTSSTAHLTSTRTVLTSLARVETRLRPRERTGVLGPQELLETQLGREWLHEIRQRILLLLERIDDWIAETNIFFMDAHASVYHLIDATESGRTDLIGQSPTVRQRETLFPKQSSSSSISRGQSGRLTSRTPNRPDHG